MVAAGLWPENDPRDPSESIASAWEVVEKLRADGWSFAIDDLGYLMDEGGNEALPGRNEWRARFDTSDNKRWAHADADTAPHAISLAALKAVESQNLAPGTPG